jgi:hypothetical protein
MVATHSVKINGVWYRPGEEIKGKAEDKNTSAFSNHMNPPEYTKTEISRMSTADLKKLAKELDIEEADTYTGADLKKLLVDKLGL